jgi:hypothetical protein
MTTDHEFGLQEVRLNGCSNYLSRRGAVPVSPSRSAPAMRLATMVSGFIAR